MPVAGMGIHLLEIGQREGMDLCAIACAFGKVVIAGDVGRCQGERYVRLSF